MQFCSRYWIYFLVIFLVQSGCLKVCFATERKIASSLTDIYKNHRQTFFCDIPFSAQQKVDFQACEKCPHVSTSIQWIPLVTSQHMAQHLRCYQEKICIHPKNGQRFKGLSCCKKTNETYQHMQQDLHNRVPEIAFFKQQRKEYRFGIIPSENLSPADYKHGNCHFYIDKKHKRIEPAPQIRGIIARTYLYMQDTYQIMLTEEERRLFLHWHQHYPPSTWERERNQKIYTLQGNSNHYIF